MVSTYFFIVLPQRNEALMNQLNALVTTTPELFNQATGITQSIIRAEVTMVKACDFPLENGSLTTAVGLKLQFADISAAEQFENSWPPNDLKQAFKKQFGRLIGDEFGVFCNRDQLRKEIEALKQMQSNVGQNASNVGQNPSNVGQSPSNVGQSPSNVGQSPSNVSQTNTNQSESSQNNGSQAKRGIFSNMVQGVQNIFSGGQQTSSQETQEAQQYVNNALSQMQKQNLGSILNEQEYNKLPADMKSKYVGRLFMVQLARLFDRNEIGEYLRQLQALSGDVCLHIKNNQNNETKQVCAPFRVVSLAAGVPLMIFTEHQLKSATVSISIDINLNSALNLKSLENEWFPNKGGKFIGRGPCRDNVIAFYEISNANQTRSVKFNQSASLHLLSFGYYMVYSPNPYIFWLQFAKYTTACAMQLSVNSMIQQQNLHRELQDQLESASLCRTEQQQQLLSVELCCSELEQWLIGSRESFKHRKFTADIASSADAFATCFHVAMRDFVSYYQINLTDAAADMLCGILLLAHSESPEQLKHFGKAKLMELNVLLQALDYSSNSSTMHKSQLLKYAKANPDGFIALLSKMKINDNEDGTKVLLKFLSSDAVPADAELVQKIVDSGKFFNDLPVMAQVSIVIKANRDPKHLVQNVKQRSEVMQILRTWQEQVHDAELQAQLIDALQQKWLELLKKDADEDKMLKLQAEWEQQLQPQMHELHLSHEMKDQVEAAVRDASCSSFDSDKLKGSEDFIKRAMHFLEQTPVRLTPQEAVQLLESVMADSHNIEELRKKVAGQLPMLRVTRVVLEGVQQQQSEPQAEQQEEEGEGEEQEEQEQEQKHEQEQEQLAEQQEAKDDDADAGVWQQPKQQKKPDRQQQKEKKEKEKKEREEKEKEKKLRRERLKKPLRCKLVDGVLAPALHLLHHDQSKEKSKSTSGSLFRTLQHANRDCALPELRSLWLLATEFVLKQLKELPKEQLNEGRLDMMWNDLEGSENADAEVYDVFYRFCLSYDSAPIVMSFLLKKPLPHHQQLSSARQLQHQLVHHLLKLKESDQPEDKLKLMLQHKCVWEWLLTEQDAAAELLSQLESELEFAQKWAEKLKNSRLTKGEFKDLLSKFGNISDDIWPQLDQCLRAFRVELAEPTAELMGRIDRIIERYDDEYSTVQEVLSFLKKQKGVTGVEEYESTLAELHQEHGSKANTMRRCDLIEQTFPEFDVEEVRKLRQLLKSTIYASVLIDVLNDLELPIVRRSAYMTSRARHSVQTVFDNLKVAQIRYRSFLVTDLLTLDMSEVRKRINKDTDVEVEQQVAQQFFELGEQDIDGELLRDIVACDEWMKRLELVTSDQLSELFLDEVLSNCEMFTDVILCDQSVRKFKSAMAIIRQEWSHMSDNQWNVLQGICSAKDLFEFLSEQVDSDFQQLFDAANDEDSGEIGFSQINSLIKLQKAFRLLISKIWAGQMEHKTTIEELADTLQQSINYFSDAQDEDEDKKVVSIKNSITECSSQLVAITALHDSLSSRGDSSRKQALSLIELEVEGNLEVRIEIKRDCSTCSCVLYDTEACEDWALSKLTDHRSRMLMILGSSYSLVESGDRTNLQSFVELIDLTEKVFHQQQRLANTGHPLYRDISIQEPTKQLLSIEKTSCTVLEQWELVLKEVRSQHHELRLLFGSNLLQMHQFCLDPTKKSPDVDAILQFMNLDADGAAALEPISFDESGMKALTSESERAAKLRDHLQNMAKQLAQLKKIPRRQAELLTTPSGDSSSEELQPRPGQPLVVRVDPADQPHCVRALLDVWRRSTQLVLPLPAEVLFCTADTVDREISLLLQRCASSQHAAIHYIADAEQLGQRMLNHLISELLQHMEAGTSGRLVVLCRTQPQHRLCAVFRDKCVPAPRLHDDELRRLLAKVCEHVTFVTSARPGCGKTELIRRRSASRFVDNPLKVVHLSGDVSKRSVMQQLRAARIRPADVLHLDVGWFSEESSRLETILFEAVFVRLIANGNSLLAFRPRHVFVEVANSVNDELLRRFKVLSLCRTESAEWQGVDGFHVSLEPRSPVQVVCKYWSSVRAGTIDRSEVSLDTILPEDKCRRILEKIFRSSGGDAEESFLTLNSSLRILADQLKKMSSSAFFKVETIAEMFGRRGDPTVRRELVEFIVMAVKNFMAKSVKSARSSQLQSRLNSTDIFKETVARFENFLSWESFQHVFPVFQKRDISCVELLYPRLQVVPDEIRRLFEKNMTSGRLKDFAEFSQDELFEKLARIASSSSQANVPASLRRNYALTADNLLKMILITVRVDTDVPVLIVGETGCGKTSLIRYLSHVHGADLRIVNFHAGIEQSQIVQKVEEAAAAARLLLSRRDDKTIWMFLDEINTCDHLGLLKEVVCHKRLLGKPLPPNLRFLAASNPYRLRDPSAALTAGFQLAESRCDKMRSLVYRVNPLPESILDFVWDFGRLQDGDELSYVRRMIADQLEKLGQEVDIVQLRLIAEAVWKSQKFIRQLERTEYAISLRDVRRFCEFLTFFADFYERKAKAKQGALAMTSSMDFNKRFLMSLYICYYVRIRSTESRRMYIRDVMLEATKHESVEEVEKLLREQQEDVLQRMDLPHNVAHNAALLENVFNLMCCALNRVPVFLVGKPGCSKSLAVSLLRSNLRGRDSPDAFFKRLPALRFFCYQGSEASTSEGIQKVFARAIEKVAESKDDEYRVVVLLDEIGLAEKSRHNPLKVLHSLLEPDDAEFTCKAKVAVIGVSNWALDPAKMNRAVHISRPDMDVHELLKTGQAIVLSDPKKDSNIGEEQMRQIAEACAKYFADPETKDFHGLRDYYYLLKYLAKENFQMSSEKLSLLTRGLIRNFGGQSQPAFLDVFEQQFKDLKKSYQQAASSSDKVELIEKNLDDAEARHLMLISDTDRDLDLLAFVLRKKSRQFRVMHGSAYTKDAYSEQYTLRKLHEIMMCMENGIVVIFKDFELVYGSLYDMLNQNYSSYNGRRYCRVAMGNQANKNCSVDDKFRCVVLVHQRHIADVDKAFLNRFEKQTFSFSDVLPEEMQQPQDELEQFVKSATTLTTTKEEAFQPEEVFVGHYPELLSSFLLTDKTSSSSVRERLVCEQAFPDAVLRLSLTPLPDDERLGLQRQFFQSLTTIGEQVDELLKRSDKEKRPVKAAVYTRSRTETSTSGSSGWLQQLRTGSCKQLRLVEFSREDDVKEELLEALRPSSSSAANQRRVVLLHAKPTVDCEHLPQLRWLLDSVAEQAQAPAVLLLLLHLGQEDLEAGSSWQWSPLMDWSLVTLEELEAGAESNATLKQLVESKSLTAFAEDSQNVQRAARQRQALALAEAAQPQEAEAAARLLRECPVLADAVTDAAVSMTRRCNDAEVSDDRESLSARHWVVQLSRDAARLATFGTFAEFAQEQVCSSVQQQQLRLLQQLQRLGGLSLKAEDLDECKARLLCQGAVTLLRCEPEEEVGVKEEAAVRVAGQLRFPFSGFAMQRLMNAAAAAAAAGNDEVKDDVDDDVEQVEKQLQQFLEKFSLKADSSDAELLYADLLQLLLDHSSPGSGRQLLASLQQLLPEEKQEEEEEEEEDQYEVEKEEEEQQSKPVMASLLEQAIASLEPSAANLERLQAMPGKWQRLAARALHFVGDLAEAERLSVCEQFCSTLLLPFRLPTRFLQQFHSLLLVGQGQLQLIFSEDGFKRINALLEQSLKSFNESLSPPEEQLQLARRLQYLWLQFTNQAAARGRMTPKLVEELFEKLLAGQLPASAAAAMWRHAAAGRASASAVLRQTQRMLQLPAASCQELEGVLRCLCDLPPDLMRRVADSCEGEEQFQFNEELEFKEQKPLTVGNIAGISRLRRQLLKELKVSHNGSKVTCTDAGELLLATIQQEAVNNVAVQHRHPALLCLAQRLLLHASPLQASSWLSARLQLQLPTPPSHHLGRPFVRKEDVVAEDGRPAVAVDLAEVIERHWPLESEAAVAECQRLLLAANSEHPDGVLGFSVLKWLLPGGGADAPCPLLQVSPTGDARHSQLARSLAAGACVALIGREICDGTAAAICDAIRQSALWSTNLSTVQQNCSTCNCVMIRVLQQQPQQQKQPLPNCENCGAAAAEQQQQQQQQLQIAGACRGVARHVACVVAASLCLCVSQPLAEAVSQELCQLPLEQLFANAFNDAEEGVSCETLTWLAHSLLPEAAVNFVSLPMSEFASELCRAAAVAASESPSPTPQLLDLLLEPDDCLQQAGVLPASALQPPLHAASAWAATLKRQLQQPHSRLLRLVAEFQAPLLAMRHVAEAARWHRRAVGRIAERVTEAEFKQLRVGDVAEPCQAAVDAFKALNLPKLSSEQPLASTLLLRDSPLMAAAKEAADACNRFLEAAAALAVDACTSVGHLLPSAASSDSTCVTFSCRSLLADTADDDDDDDKAWPSLSLEELETIAVDVGEDWRLLEVALGHRTTLRKFWSLVEPWRPTFAQLRSPAALLDECVVELRRVVPGGQQALTPSAASRLAELLAAVPQLPRQLADACLGLVRCASARGWQPADCGLQLEHFAENCRHLAPESSTQLPASVVSALADAQSLTLRELPALLRAALQQQLLLASRQLIKLRHAQRLDEVEAATVKQLAENAAAPVEGLELLRQLLPASRVACALHLLLDDGEEVCERPLRSLLQSPGLWPMSEVPAIVDEIPEEARGACLFPLAERLRCIDDDVIDTEEKLLRKFGKEDEPFVRGD